MRYDEMSKTFNNYYGTWASSVDAFWDTYFAVDEKTDELITGMMEEANYIDYYDRMFFDADDNDVEYYDYLVMLHYEELQRLYLAAIPGLCPRDESYYTVSPLPMEDHTPGSNSRQRARRRA